MDFFIWLAFLIIIIGGVISAFAAPAPSRFVMWLTAYLVLIGGVVQFALAYFWNHITEGDIVLATIAFILYNLANIAVIYGRWKKHQSRVALSSIYAGGVLLAISMIIFIIDTWSAQLSAAHSIFLVFVIVILVSMPIGMILASRRRKK